MALTVKNSVLFDTESDLMPLQLIFAHAFIYRQRRRRRRARLDTSLARYSSCTCTSHAPPRPCPSLVIIAACMRHLLYALKALAATVHASYSWSHDIAHDQRMSMRAPRIRLVRLQRAPAASGRRSRARRVVFNECPLPYHACVLLSLIITSLHATYNKYIRRVFTY